jgi:hypothetical protein
MQGAVCGALAGQMSKLKVQINSKLLNVKLPPSGWGFRSKQVLLNHVLKAFSSFQTTRDTFSNNMALP